VFAVYLLINVHNHIALALRPVWIFSLEASFVRFFYTQRTLGVGGGAVFDRRESAAPGHQPVKPGRDLDPHHLAALLALFGPLLAAVVCCAAAISSVFYSDTPLPPAGSLSSSREDPLTLRQGNRFPPPLVHHPSFPLSQNPAYYSKPLPESPAPTWGTRSSSSAPPGAAR
jgi:hypothetical protein